jgi:hypothetical protein
MPHRGLNDGIVAVGRNITPALYHNSSEWATPEPSQPADLTPLTHFALGASLRSARGCDAGKLRVLCSSRVAPQPKLFEESANEREGGESQWLSVPYGSPALSKDQDRGLQFQRLFSSDPRAELVPRNDPVRRAEGADASSGSRFSFPAVATQSRSWLNRRNHASQRSLAQP